MCGIVYVKKAKEESAVRSVLKRYDFQSHRGKQGFGFVAVQKNKVVAYERDENEDGIKAKLNALKDIGIIPDEILYHHRYPTSTPNTENTAHPIHISCKTLKYDYYVVHNGVITNPTALRKKHEELGFEYTTDVETITEVLVRWDSNGKKLPKSKRIKEPVSVIKFNDSEALAIELALWNEGIIPEMNLEGGYAFIALQVEKKTNNIVRRHWGRKTSPLKIISNKEIFSITSESDKTDVMFEEGVMHSVNTNGNESEDRRFMPKPVQSVYKYNSNSCDESVSGYCRNHLRFQCPGWKEIKPHSYHEHENYTPVLRRCATCQRELGLRCFTSRIEEHKFVCDDCVDDIIESMKIDNPTNVKKLFDSSGKEIQNIDNLQDDIESKKEEISMWEAELNEYEKGTEEYIDMCSLIDGLRIDVKRLQTTLSNLVF